MNTPQHLQSLYECRIDRTNDFVHKFDRIDFSLAVTPEELAKVKPEPIITIRMPETEYERFCVNWNTYMDLMLTAMSDPIVREQYHQLLMLVALKK